MKTISHGKITMPKAAHTAQMFSHFQTLAYLMGAAKLPLMNPRDDCENNSDGNARHELTSDEWLLRMVLPGGAGPHQLTHRRPATRMSREDYH